MARSQVTLDDIAKLSGFSKATVSRILSALPGASIPFSTQTQVRVRQVAQQQGYRPSHLARGLINSRTHIIGLVIPSVQDTFFPNLTEVIEGHLATAGYSVLLANTRNSIEAERKKIDEMLSWRVDGLIIAAAQLSLEAGHFWDLWRDQVPFVLLDRTYAGTPFASVTTDDAAGTTAAIEFLIGRGKTRIACAGGPTTISTFRTRRLAYRETLIRKGILPREDYIIETPTTVEGGRLAVERLLALEPRPDALFCLNDGLAAGAMQACLELGVRVPQELALFGYADLSYSSMLRVPLTTVRQPCDQIGRATAEELLARLVDNPPAPQQHVVGIELIVRDSV